MLISAIAAVNSNLGIGKNNHLLYHIPNDLRRFQKLTSGKPIIMGRKTYESIVAGTGGEPLAYRTNIVITSKRIDHPGVHSARNLRKALEIAADKGNKVFIIGGQRVYEEALPFIERLYLTLIKDTSPADVYFPSYQDHFVEAEEEHKGPFNWKGLYYEFATFIRK